MSMPHVDTVLVPRIPRVPVITSLSFSFSGKRRVWRFTRRARRRRRARYLARYRAIRTKDGSDRTGRVRRGADRRRAAAVWESNIYAVVNYARLCSRGCSLHKTKRGGRGVARTPYATDSDIIYPRRRRLHLSYRRPSRIRAARLWSGVGRGRARSKQA